MERVAPKLSIIVPVKDDERIFGLLARLSESWRSFGKEWPGMQVSSYRRLQ